ncbi:MAG: hypothetical protein ACFFDI_23210 [Promethearchaeota archaeon]
MSKNKQKKDKARYYPPELTQFMWCSACLGIALEQSEEASDIFEDIIDCLDLPGIKETFDKVEDELPDSKYILKKIVKEAGYDVKKAPSAESLGITHLRGLFRGGIRFIPEYSKKYISWALKARRSRRDFQLLVNKIEELIRVGFKNKINPNNSDTLVQALFILVLSIRHELLLEQVEKANIIRSKRELFTVEDLLNRTMTSKLNRAATRNFKSSGFCLTHEDTIESTALKWYQCRVVYSGPEKYCRQMDLKGVTEYPSNVSRQIKACDEAMGYPRRELKKEREIKEQQGFFSKLKRIIIKK